MFVDASAIVAILTREPEADSLADLLEAAPSPITSPIAVFEAALGICRKRHASVEEAEDDVREFLELARIQLIPITAKEADTALAAFSRYGKGRGIPRSSTSAIVLPMRWRRTTGRHCCSRARISIRPMSDLQQLGADELS